jgi:hypothetical protein
MTTSAASPIATVVHCPICGAPLDVTATQASALCIYCRARVHIEHPSSGAPRASQTATISEADLAEIQRLLMDGKRDEAVEKYRSLAGCAPDEAARAIESLFVRKVFFAAINRQILSPSGVAGALASTAVLGGAIVGGALGTVPAALAWLGGIVAFVFLPIRASKKTLAYLGAERGVATLKKVVWLGEENHIHAFRALVDVAPGRGSPFVAEMALLARTRSKVREGERIKVKFFSGRPDSVVLAEKPTDSAA